MTRPDNQEDWLLQTAGGSAIVSWPEPEDVLHGAHHTGPPRVSFGYSLLDAPQIEPLAGAHAWLTGASGRRMRVRIEQVDPDLKVAVAQVEAQTIDAPP